MQMTKVRFACDLRRITDKGLRLLLEGTAEDLHGLSGQLHDELTREADLRSEGRPAVGRIELDLAQVTTEELQKLVRGAYAVRDAQKMAVPEELDTLTAVGDFLFGVIREIGGFYFPAQGVN